MIKCVMSIFGLSVLAVVIFDSFKSFLVVSSNFKVSLKQALGNNHENTIFLSLNPNIKNTVSPFLSLYIYHSSSGEKL